MNRILFYIWAAILAGVAVLIVHAIVHACAFTLTNNTGDLRIMSLYWVDHYFKDYPRPARMICAELKPGKSRVFEENYPGRYFYVECYIPARAGTDDEMSKVAVDPDATAAERIEVFCVLPGEDQ